MSNIQEINPEQVDGTNIGCGKESKSPEADVAKKKLSPVEKGHVVANLCNYPSFNLNGSQIAQIKADIREAHYQGYEYSLKELAELRAERNSLKEQKQGLLLALHNQGEKFKAENERLKSQLKIEIEANEEVRKAHRQEKIKVEQQQSLIHELTEGLESISYTLRAEGDTCLCQGLPEGDKCYVPTQWLAKAKSALQKSKEFQSKAKQP